MECVLTTADPIRTSVGASLRMLSPNMEWRRLAVGKTCLPIPQRPRFSPDFADLPSARKKLKKALSPAFSRRHSAASPFSPLVPKSSKTRNPASPSNMSAKEPFRSPISKWSFAGLKRVAIAFRASGDAFGTKEIRIRTSRSFAAPRVAASSEFWMPSRMSASLRFSRLSAMKNASLAESRIRSQGRRGLKCHCGFIVFVMLRSLALRFYLGAKILTGLRDDVGDAEAFLLSGDEAEVHQPGNRAGSLRGQECCGDGLLGRQVEALAKALVHGVRSIGP